MFATVDQQGRPVTCAIDMMDCDENGLYFLTAKGKSFYRRLKQNVYVAFTAMKGEDTMSRVAVSVRGRAEELGPERLPALFAQNPYMAKIYPDEASRSALTVFRICEGTGEWFDLSKMPVERASFSFGGGRSRTTGISTDRCIGCPCCANARRSASRYHALKPVVIRQENRLHYGNC